jgi:hypothetical protein
MATEKTTKMPDDGSVPEEMLGYSTPSAAARGAVPPSQALVKSEANKIDVPLDKWGAVAPVTLDQSLRVARWVVESKLAPVKSQAEAWLVLDMGARLHFGGMCAFAYIYPVQGRARITPAGIKAVALASGQVEDFSCELSGEGEGRKATAMVKRKGIPTPVIKSFSMADAKKAGLLSKDNWRNYPDRLCEARANGFAWGDAFPDLTAGMQVREMFDRDEEDDRVAPATPDPLLQEVVDAEVS